MAEEQRPLRWSQRPFIGPFSARQLAAVVGTLVVAGFLIVALTSPLAGAPGPTPPRPGSGFVPVGEEVEGLRIGDRAPELEGEVGGVEVELRDLDGNVIRLADLRGRPVWINFWATWCPPCQEETPVLREMHEKYAGQGLELVAISVQETTVEDVRSYVERYDLRYTVGFDATSAIFHAYHAFGLPTQLFLDRDGVIRDIVLGPVTREQAEEIIQPLLAGSSVEQGNGLGQCLDRGRCLRVD
ncbi:MAG TPA: TlpA disulfide reductase family protein [Candidatus Limnocylindria bacterium]|nr:TlpA disulfide reductase family protein [Candidatus Limnocylindria bacterium]